MAAGDPLGWFEPLYASASNDPATIPWANLKPNPILVSWLDARQIKIGGRALTVGCGLGDDAEELARRGFRVTAFDLAPTAIEWCKRRFPRSAVEYAVANLLNPPPHWRGAFDFVLESYTLQAMPARLRETAVRSLAQFLAPSGELLLICRGRSPEEPEGELPWPLTRPELNKLSEGAGLVEQEFQDFFDEEVPPVRRFRCVYTRS
jgi:SAM-dependent methyltransferase